MTTDDLIRSAMTGKAVDAILELRNACPGLGESYPKNCQTSYVIGWLDALSSSAQAVRKALEPMPIDSSSLVNTVLETAMKGLDNLTMLYPQLRPSPPRPADTNTAR